MSVMADEFDCPSQDRVVLALLAFITPILAGVFLPWWSVLWLIVSLLFAMAIIALAGYPKIARHLPEPLVLLLIAFGFQLWGEVSGWLGFLVGLFILLFGCVHLLLWVNFLDLGNPRVQHNLDLRFQGTRPALAVAPRTSYCPQHSTVWLATSADGFAWAVDARVANGLRTSIDRWSPRVIAQDVVEDSLVPRASSSIVNPAVQEAHCRGEIDASGHLIFTSPQGGHMLRGEPVGVEPGYSLWLDDQPSGLLLEQGASVLWRDDGEALACRARAESQPVEEIATWLWQASSGWRPLDVPWQSLDDEPQVEWRAPSRLEGARLVYDAWLRPSTDRPSTAACPLKLCIELDGDQTERVSLLLPAMQGGVQPCLKLLRKSRDGRRHAFSCMIGDWQLPGLWCLDQLTSDCGRYLALTAFAEAPAVVHRLAVADVLARRLIFLEQAFLIAGLDTFQEGVITLQQITGRQAAVGAGGLPRLEAQAPAADQADAFVAQGRLQYRSVRVAVDPWSLRPIPNWRVQSGPVPASALGDYVLPAPDGRDAAWLFGLDGAEVEVAAQAPGGACVLTASGCALADLAPSLIWSTDGRYLALTRRVAGADGAAWYLLVLDTHEHTLRHSDQPLEQSPCLQAFDETGLHVAGAAQVAELITMQALLTLPRQMLIRSGDIWLPAEQLSDAVHWLRLDREHLQSWQSLT